MSTSLLYHRFGLRGPFHYRSTSYVKNVTIFNIAHNAHFKCPECRSHKVIKKGTKTRSFLATPIGLNPSVLRINHQRIYCHKCSFIGYLPLNFVPKEKVRYTKNFEQYVLSLLRQNITILSVAKLCHVCWDTVKDIQKRYLKKRYHRPSLKDVTHIGIDEIYCGAKTGYMTVVIDMKTSAVIYTEKGKKAASLDAFWLHKNKCKKPIEAVATDMGNAYISSVKKHAPDARLVIDRFHVVKLFNDKLTTFRRQLQNELTEKTDRTFLKNTRWLLVSNPENLNDSGQVKLNNALSLNKPLATMYYLKEKLRMLWTLPSKEEAEKWLINWFSEAESADIPILKTMTKTLRKHRVGILAYYDEKMSSGKVEGVNNRIKTINKMAYGYRDLAFFELKIKASHEARY